MVGENSARKQRGRPFQPGQSGNPAGKPKGARNRSTLAAEALLDGEAEGLTRKAIELALGGDAAALRLCLERLLPPRKERLLTFSIPEIVDADGVPVAINAVLQGVAKGELTLSEAAAISSLIRALCAMAFEDNVESFPRTPAPQVNVHFEHSKG